MDSSTKAKRREEFVALVQSMGPLPTSALAAGESPRDGNLPGLMVGRAMAARAVLEDVLAAPTNDIVDKNVDVLVRHENGWVMWEVKAGPLSARVRAASKKLAVKLAHEAIENVLAPPSQNRHVKFIRLVRHPEGYWEMKVESGPSELVFAATKAEAVKAFRSEIEKVLAERRVSLTHRSRARLDACADPLVLERWHERAIHAATEAEVFNG